MKLIAAAFVLVMSAGMDCNSPTGSSRSTTEQEQEFIRHESPPSSSVIGYVRDNASHMGIRGAKVCLVEGECRTSVRNGYYDVSALSTGEIMIITTHPQYKPDTTYVKVISGERVRQDIQLRPVGS